MVSSGDGIDLLLTVAKICPNIVYLVPRNTSDEQIHEMQQLSGLPCRAEKVYLHKKMKMIVLYFGELFLSNKDRRILSEVQSKQQQTKDY